MRLEATGTLRTQELEGHAACRCADRSRWFCLAVLILPGCNVVECVKPIMVGRWLCHYKLNLRMQSLRGSCLNHTPHV